MYSERLSDLKDVIPSACRFKMEIRLPVVLFLVLVAKILSTSAAAEKRAVPHQIPWPRNATFNEEITLKTTLADNNVSKETAKTCPEGQLPHQDDHNSTVCCLPTACSPGFYIVPCTEDGGEDLCRRCKPGYLQPNHISSANLTAARCFEYIPRKHDNCALGDTKNHSGPYNDICPYWCVCDSDRCFHGDPCYCSSHRECGVNEEFDPVANKCVKCPWYAYKKDVSCKRCQVNITLWRSGHQDRKGEFIAEDPTTLPTNGSSSVPETEIVPFDDDDENERTFLVQPSWVVKGN